MFNFYHLDPNIDAHMVYLNVVGVPQSTFILKANFCSSVTSLLFTRNLMLDVRVLHDEKWVMPSVAMPLGTRKYWQFRVFTFTTYFQRHFKKFEGKEVSFFLI